MGLFVAVVPLAIFRKNAYVVMGAIPQVIANAITGTMETFANIFYNTAGSLPFLIASAPMLAAFMVLLLHYSVKKEKNPGQENNTET